ncbi:MAG: YqgE/AlgH family protein [Desulfobulbaceae bacterium]|uniref:UPF0301 protein H8E79_02060 n=1 Tax=Candidatus Desulfatifera sulfidica TaxID=2841691 RepID=A0A8J6NAK7_9BACT|nr:YqgE/AlgH family protein [Candidatus Desulfatifera sulfidica]
MENLTGSFLISTPKMPDPRFAEQVIYICAHNHEGAMGVIVNRPEPSLSMADIFMGACLPQPEQELPLVHVGGPVEMDAAFIVYTSEYRVQHQIEISQTLSLSRESKVLEDIAHGHGPRKFMLFLGYAGWGAGQLERELLDEGWLVVPGDDAIIFDIPDHEKWKRAAFRYGIDIAVFDDTTGMA